MILRTNLLDWLKSKTYTKEEIDEAIGNISNFDYETVDTLPNTGAKGTIYLLRNENPSSTDNLYDGYLWIGNDWELIGPRVDLSDYYTSNTVDSLLDGKANSSHIHAISDITNLQSALDGASGGDLSSLDDLITGGIFVSVGGDDTNGAGTYSNPYATLGKAISEVTTGGVIFMMTGVYNNFAEVTINKSCSVIGLGEVVLDARENNRHLSISGSSVELYLQGLTFRNGNVENNNGDNRNGGAIHNRGNLTINDCIFYNNNGQYGGAIFSNTSHTFTIISNSIFSENTASFLGEAISILGSTTKLYNNIITGTGTQISGTIADRKGNIVNGVADYETNYITLTATLADDSTVTYNLLKKD